MTALMRCAIAIVLAFAAITCVGNPATQPAQEQKALVEFSGAHSKIAQRAYLRITSLKEFRDTYMRHLGKEPSLFDEYYNENNVPTIDFERCMVIAVFQGAGWNSAGVRVVSIIDEPNRLVVRFDERTYQTSSDFTTNGRLNTDVKDAGNKVTAYGMFVLPRTEKAVVLEEDVKQYKHPPSVWKEVARFPSIASK